MKTNKCYCEGCNSKVEYKIDNINKEQITLGFTRFKANQKHAWCSICGKEVYPSIIVNYCVKKAHRAYLRMLLNQGKFSKFFRHFWHDLRRFKL